MKHCSRCGAMKPLDAFWQMKTGRYAPNCKDCAKAVRRAAYLKRNPDARAYEPEKTRRAKRTQTTLRSDGMKQCPRCEQMLPVERFTHDRTRPDGLFPYCRECKRAHKQDRKQKDAATRRVYNARPEVRERLNALQRTPRYRARHQRYVQRHREKVRTTKREYNRRNPERTRAWSMRTRIKNAERLTENKRRYYYDGGGREVAAAARARNRVRRLAAQVKRQNYLNGEHGRFTAEEWQALKARYDFTCLCCHQSETDGILLTPDHVVPISRGGSNTIDNIQPLCQHCNAVKHARTIDYRPTWKRESA